MNIEPGSVYDVIMTCSALLQDPDRVAAVSSTPRLDVELLLAQTLKKTRSELILSHNYKLLPNEISAFKSGFVRRSQGEPIAYILGRKAFWNFDLMVTPDTLIPRPETETLVEVALHILMNHELPDDSETMRVCDLGTGSGAIALALATELPNAHVVGVDRYLPALQCARHNGSRLCVQNISWLQSNWLLPFEGQQVFSLVVANPPYIDSQDPHLSAPEMNYEPRHALISTDNGYADLFAIIDQATWVLQRPGWLILEHGDQQAALLHERMERVGFTDIRTFQDLADKDRVTVGKVASLFKSSGE